MHDYLSVAAAVNLAKVISKLSPLLGNLIEFNTVEFLNKQEIFAPFGEWKRQDPGFPDTVFMGSIQPTPGLEIKAWFPLATKITARFKDSQNHFQFDQTYVSLIVGLRQKTNREKLQLQSPLGIYFEKPKIAETQIYQGKS